MLREDGADVYFKQTKSNYSRPMHDELRLVRGPGGLLRVPSAGENEQHKERVADLAGERATAKAAERDARREARVLATMEAMVEAVRAAAAPVTSRAGLVGLVTGEKATREDALARLLSGGRLVPPTAKGAGYTAG